MEQIVGVPENVILLGDIVVNRISTTSILTGSDVNISMSLTPFGIFNLNAADGATLDIEFPDGFSIPDHSQFGADLRPTYPAVGRFQVNHISERSDAPELSLPTSSILEQCSGFESKIHQPELTFRALRDGQRLGS